MTIDQKKIARQMEVYAESSAALAMINTTLLALDKISLKPFYRNQIKNSGNLFKKAIEGMFTGLFTAPNHMKPHLDEGVQQYSDMFEYLKIHATIFAILNAFPKDTQFAFYSDLEHVLIKHELLKEKGDLLKELGTYEEMNQD